MPTAKGTQSTMWSKSRTPSPSLMNGKKNWILCLSSANRREE